MRLQLINLLVWFDFNALPVALIVEQDPAPHGFNQSKRFDRIRTEVLRGLQPESFFHNLIRLLT